MQKYAHETVVGIFVVIGLACVGYMAVKFGDVSLFGEDTYTLYARFNSVSGLQVGNPVEMLGIEVGKVADFDMDQEKLLAVVALKIDNGIKIYGDAIASIKTAGLIGDKYVRIDPGGAEELLEPGGVIIDTESPIDLEEAISKYAFGDVGGALEE
jgi:phospholipid/cholesterol/gamma-HCH transport system substrate-binding protein